MIEALERGVEPKRKGKEHRPRPITPGTKEWFEQLREEDEHSRTDD